MKSLACLADLSLNWVIRCSSPSEAVHSMIQPSWECSGTWLCTNSVHWLGSSPAARSMVAMSSVFWRSVAGSCGNVRAWRSTMAWKLSWACCSRVQTRIAPR